MIKRKINLRQGKYNISLLLVWMIKRVSKESEAEHK